MMMSVGRTLAEIDAEEEMKKVYKEPWQLPILSNSAGAAILNAAQYIEMEDKRLADVYRGFIAEQIIGLEPSVPPDPILQAMLTLSKEVVEQGREIAELRNKLRRGSKV